MTRQPAKPTGRKGRLSERVSRRLFRLARYGRRAIDRIRLRSIVAGVKTLTAIITPAPDGKWLVAWNPEAGTTTQGRTFDEALANLKEATALYLSEFPLPRAGRAVMTTCEYLQRAIGRKICKQRPDPCRPCGRPAPVRRAKSPSRRKLSPSP